jgi:mono/diheme cytochrome c family protein
LEFESGIKNANFLVRTVAILIVSALLAAMVWTAVMPRIDWRVARQPGILEKALAKSVIGLWINYNLTTAANRIPPTAENLKAGQNEYEEHCVTCQGLDGNGSNRFRADFNPPVPKLTGEIQKLSDAELYFVIAHRIRITPMPAFGAHHSPDEIWRTTLWVRLLPELSSAERKEIEKQTSDQERHHQEVMKQGGMNHDMN